jgi:hypothetical protein
VRVLLLSCLLASPLAIAAVEPGPGLTEGQGRETVVRHCTVCHSARLIAQSRGDRDGWRAMIRWMQETQGLWPLGGDEAIILDYLEASYPPLRSGRRKPLRVNFD